MDIITRNMKMGEIEEILLEHDVPLGFMWEFIISGLLLEYEALEVHSYGKYAYFEGITEKSEVQNEINRCR